MSEKSVKHSDTLRAFFANNPVEYSDGESREKSATRREVLCSAIQRGIFSEGDEGIEHLRALPNKGQFPIGRVEILLASRQVGTEALCQWIGEKGDSDPRVVAERALAKLLAQYAPKTGNNA